MNTTQPGAQITPQPKANISAGRKTLNNIHPLEIPRKKKFEAPINTRPERVTKKTGNRANEQSKTPPKKYLRKRPQSAKASCSYDNNIILNPPENKLFTRKKSATPTYSSNRASLSSENLTDLISHNFGQQTENVTSRRKPSPMSLRSSFEGTLIPKAEHSATLTPTTKYWKVPNNNTIELKPKPRGLARSDSMKSILLWE
ncbi:hypothetical protein ABK040_011916 [Willaertia magna]